MNEPSAPALHLFNTLRAAIDLAVADRDPGMATEIGEQFMTPDTPSTRP